MNRVSDERLAELIARYEKLMSVADEFPAVNLPTAKDILCVFTELQAIRTAAVAGVEEAAESEVVRMVRKSEYDALMREHLEVRADRVRLDERLAALESQLAAQASAVEGIKKAIHDQGLELIEEGGEYRLELKPAESTPVRDFLNLSVMARAALVNDQSAKEER